MAIYSRGVHILNFNIYFLSHQPYFPTADTLRSVKSHPTATTLRHYSKSFCCQYFPMVTFPNLSFYFFYAPYTPHKPYDRGRGF